MFVVSDKEGAIEMIHRAARLAARIKAPLDVVRIVNGDSVTAATAEIMKLREVSISVGARWHEIIADDWIESLMNFAKENKITQIAMGAQASSHWRAPFGSRASLQKLLRISTQAGIDVHVIALARDPSSERLRDS